ncbi:acetyl-CoA carboxylase biotin carboxyl carrier protein [Nitrospirillum sp. BR 11828]|uniref:acetyl-CoA carboxylase biotin carboxyl carrier protein n=1 Tax=Nitrospirillum sp. BR 11828 TaxID=3104325 RepID=UPI002ACAC50B|nr:biotin/lipoyl-containing protein [Nitrospirillum sp. BR 11828]MDZ5649871.1 biotin/lipoyl-containing protein [Nitrospirillum sp. BR 11828]
MVESYRITASQELTVISTMVRQMVDLMHQTELGEMECSWHNRRLRISRDGIRTDLGIALATPASQGAPVERADAPPAPPITVTCPFVGVARLVGVADAAGGHTLPGVPLIGAQVRRGQTVMAVEMMTIRRAIPAPRAGRVTQFLVQDGQPVEFDQPLFMIE